MKYEEYRELVKEYRGSGQSQSEWCGVHRISRETLRTWIKRVRVGENEEEPAHKSYEEFYEWLGDLNPVGTGLPKAVGYAVTQKKKLTAYLDSPNVPMSNNRAENAIRPFCIGRKNWLFSTSVKGAEASAVFYSLAATAKANDLPIEEYFTLLFKTLPEAKGNKDIFFSLLPFNIDKN